MASLPLQSNPRAARTRAAMLAAGFELLAERPIDAIAIDEVVARAGVAKGSFFNHFSDKPGFAHAIGATVRAELEALVGLANAGVGDPAIRLAGGMRVAVGFALDHRDRAIVMLRGLELSTGLHHELNRGIRADIEGLVAAGLAREEARTSGVRYWLGLCNMAMLNAIERRPSRPEAAERLREMLVLGLAGLGVPGEQAGMVARLVSAQL
ncbi:MAG: TetR/AcrR family transcriptional regulator [Novosphingobium sp.]|uniref:TetR/AcrR family transcriptional regulator n=1 Tax=Novosphingobium sp. TaxID=1874826 RepID=UPI001DC55BFA|nr:TetR/AcrR family transcriptional regulator [Novosphingobium sp.]MCB2058145.1 TetR/AcrR family transcriptional regulator [Novosphingobium sp.]MCP5387360.1 TetR/AcrR family transcriptional regulator [Novosphingobium sp.]